MRFPLPDLFPVMPGAGDLIKLADLREKGITSEAEFQQGEAKILR